MKPCSISLALPWSQLISFGSAHVASLALAMRVSIWNRKEATECLRENPQELFTQGSHLPFRLPGDIPQPPQCSPGSELDPSGFNFYLVPKESLPAPRTSAICHCPALHGGFNGSPGKGWATLLGGVGWLASFSNRPGLSPFANYFDPLHFVKKAPQHQLVPSGFNLATQLALVKVGGGGWREARQGRAQAPQIYADCLGFVPLMITSQGSHKKKKKKRTNKRLFTRWQGCVWDWLHQPPVHSGVSLPVHITFLPDLSATGCLCLIHSSFPQLWTASFPTPGSSLRPCPWQILSFMLFCSFPHSTKLPWWSSVNLPSGKTENWLAGTHEAECKKEDYWLRWGSGREPCGQAYIGNRVFFFFS